ncbi:MAG: phytanoyl-CoA dioxygenase family protein [Candidatus Poribacteria bacterium]|nr:phytanoyl-CoA dioxygenase [Candidatus Poribacteria bacterium]MBD69054.1 phytanoyl-CoA dioxygenase [Candidatus Poribacteria bacterium]MEE2618796.1 phytanoyl-CoA dioxygenase family protein [Candidatus Poribacteria bacterium]|tara:strand:- start:1112 stop:1924 length:813 start_codon:yes stop_codon:yes gene_type:complete
MIKPNTNFQVDVTPYQVDFFNDNGYLSIDRITTDEEIEWLKQIYNKLFQERVGEEQGQYFDLGGPRAHTGREVLPQVLGPESQFPELRETIFFKNAHTLAAKLLKVNKDNVNGGGHMILKPAKFGAETPWHQDEAYWNPSELPHRLSIWMPLDPSTTKSGCMQFIPKSHKGKVRFHRHINNDPLIHGLVTDDLDPSQAVACPIPAAGATFHHCRTLHYAGPNTTIEVRRAYILVLGSPGKRLEKPLPRPWIDEEQEALAKLKSLAKPRNA